MVERVPVVSRHSLTERYQRGNGAGDADERLRLHERWHLPGRGFDRNSHICLSCFELVRRRRITSKEPLGDPDTADVHRRDAGDGVAVGAASDKLGRSSTKVANEKWSLSRRESIRRSGVGERSFLLAGEQLWANTEDGLGSVEELRRVARVPRGRSSSDAKADDASRIHLGSISSKRHQRAFDRARCQALCLIDPLAKARHNHLTHQGCTTAAGNEQTR